MPVNLVVTLQDAKGEVIAENYMGSPQSAKQFARDHENAVVMRIYNVDAEEEIYYVRNKNRWSEASEKMAKYIASRNQ